MEKQAIPRLEIDAFATAGYKRSFLEVQHYPLNSNHFVIKKRDDYPVADYISPNRRQFYKIFHMTKGTGILTIGLYQYDMGPGDIAFLHPDEIMSWQTTSADTGGHFCLIHPKYFEHDADHVLQLFRNYPYFKPAASVVRLSDSQSQNINEYFEFIVKEVQEDYDDKKQALLLHLQLILVAAKRAGKKLPTRDVPESYRYIYGFLSLLESSFRLDNRCHTVKLKTASEFAEHLNVHPNYLNSLVKQHTGKTLREHIQERLIYEAKSLLVQTDWDISSISFGLGFSGPAAFTAFFKKKELISPSLFRKNAFTGSHI
ncbi:AraC family transcriptional regulator [Olivibacter sp. XZL3]|uniref:helix-turn-helix domain-containing protein n=1 Tax=Olivibacter sp. XZL3 TaxID=1735116 RepID=UPI001066B04E|nr:AraC family transcriptional regulator [Olivibacter sp. XZL3]